MQVQEYKIQVNYETGNSFGRNDTSTILKYTWTDKEIAKENLLYIKEHYDIIKGGGYLERRQKSDKQRFEEAKNKIWFTGHKDHWWWSIYLKGNDGQVNVEEHVHWTGYFEYLQSIEVIELEDPNMKIIF